MPSLQGIAEAVALRVWWVAWARASWFGRIVRLFLLAAVVGVYGYVLLPDWPDDPRTDTCEFRSAGNEAYQRFLAIAQQKLQSGEWRIADAFTDDIRKKLAGPPGDIEIPTLPRWIDQMMAEAKNNDETIAAVHAVMRSLGGHFSWQFIGNSTKIIPEHSPGRVAVFSSDSKFYYNFTNQQLGVDRWFHYLQMRIVVRGVNDNRRFERSTIYLVVRKGKFGADITDLLDPFAVLVTRRRPERGICPVISNYVNIEFNGER